MLFVLGRRFRFEFEVPVKVAIKGGTTSHIFLELVSRLDQIFNIFLRI